MRTPENLINHELIGLETEVAEADNESHRGMEGEVVDETMKTLTIETEDGEKTVPKKGSEFIFTLPSGERVRIEGDLICERPEERVKLKARKW